MPVNLYETLQRPLTIAEVDANMQIVQDVVDLQPAVVAAAALISGNLADIQNAGENATSAAASAAGAKANADIVAAAIDLVLPARINSIGTPGAAGFGVGICPTIPSGFVALPGATDPVHANYGNYMFQDGSIMCWIPKFWYRVAHASNPTYAVHLLNSVDVKGLETYTSTAAANAAGYALHRMFMDGGAEKSGCFVDKYKCSQNAWGTGLIASSIPFGNPITAAADHNPMGALTATAGINAYYGAITAAKARDGVNGAVNAASNFFCTTRFVTAGLALLSLAHGQASSSTTYCAWYSAGTTNFPKGCNNALRDVNDTSVLYTSDGYSNCGKTGSGVPFAKTTHNGQACGIADLNGLIYEINPGLTCITTVITTGNAITGISLANPCVITMTNDPVAAVVGMQAVFSSIVGTTQLNGVHTVTAVDHVAKTITLECDSTAYTAWVSGGTITTGAHYAWKTSARAKTMTPGNTLATDVWGANGVAAHSAPITVPFNNGAQAQYFGNAANQVLSAATLGDAWQLSGLGFPKDASGVSAAGSSLFGNDYFYQQFTNELVPLSSYYWNNSTAAGVWGVFLNSIRTNSSAAVGFRCACYPV